MFRESEKKKIVLVVDEKNIAYAEYLQALITQNDDEGDKIVGVKDGSVETVIFDEKKYEDNRSNMSSNQKIIFIGHMNSSENIEKMLKIKFNNLGMKYGWLGNYLLLDVEQDMLNKEELEKFESFCEKINRDLDEKEKSSLLKEGAKTAIAAGYGLIGLASLGAWKVIKGHKNKKQYMYDQRFKALILYFYLNGLNEFIGE